MTQLNTEQFWEKIYQDGEDTWTRAEADKEIMQLTREHVTRGVVGSSVFVPMCGRSKVLLQLADEGHRVVGVEWSSFAVEQFMEENKLSYFVDQCNIAGQQTPVYRAMEKNITVYCCDLFLLKDHTLGQFDCVCDHGSIGSFYPTDENRKTYAGIITSLLTPGGRMLLSMFDYDHAEHPSMPFATTEADVENLYKEFFSQIVVLKEIDAKGTAEVFPQNPSSILQLQVGYSRFSWKLLLLVKNDAK